MTTTAAVAAAIREQIPALIAEQDGVPDNALRQRLARDLTVTVIRRGLIVVLAPTAGRRFASEARNLATGLIDGTDGIPAGQIDDYAITGTSFSF